MLDSSLTPTIVVVAYNRANALERILRSLSHAFYSYSRITLVISIDFGGSLNVAKVAQDFEWNFGNKEIIIHSENLGLKKHILACGDLTETYGSVIILEDDLFVSPLFYDFTVQALRFFSSDSSICGISLYAYNFNENIEIAFCPLDDGYDNVFIQTASSWGQAWTYSQWSVFRSWLSKNEETIFSKHDSFPAKILEWPDTSWKKYYIRYMIDEEKYLVFPRTSLTTNFGDHGENHSSTSNFQVNFLVNKRSFRFSTLEESKSVYDSFFEISPHSLKSLNPQLEDIQFDCDLYGTKKLSDFKYDYALTIRDSINPLQSYTMALMPCELNIAFNISGDFFNLSLVEDLGKVSHLKQLLQIRHIHKNLGWRRYQGLWFYALLRKFLSLSGIRNHAKE